MKEKKNRSSYYLCEYDRNTSTQDGYVIFLLRKLFINGGRI